MKRRERTIHDRDYKRFLELIRDARNAAGVSQEALASQIGMTQSQFSKVERGERRLDVLEFVTVCRAIDADPLLILRRFIER